MGGWGYPWQKNPNPLAIPPGSLRAQISIQAQSTTQDAAGGQIEAWNTVLTCMAKIAIISDSTSAAFKASGKEAYQSGQFSSQLTHKVSIYWPGASVAIVGGMQVVFGARTFVIEAVQNVMERNRVLHLMCLEINGVQ